MNLPDLEAWAIFAKVVTAGSFSQAAADLGISKATVSKAIARLERRLGAHLVQRTSRRVVPTEIGRASLARAERMLAEAEAADLEATAQAATPRGKVRITAPVLFGIDHVAPLLPELLAAYPDVTLDLHLSDQIIDLVADGFDLAVRIASLADSSLRVRRLCDIHIILVGSPRYFELHGRPRHPRDLLDHRCFVYAYQSERGRHRFRSKDGEEIVVPVDGPLRTNSGDAFLPALRAGCGLAAVPEFIVWDDVAAGLLEPTMCEWRLPTVSLSLVMPPGGPRPARVNVVIDCLARHLSGAPWAHRPDGATRDGPWR